MSEQDNSPKTSTESTKSPSIPEKRFSLSKFKEKIILLISSVTLIFSLFSKDKNGDNKTPHKDTQKELKNPHEKTEKSQGTENKKVKSISVAKSEKENSNKFKEWLCKYITKDNPILDSSNLDRKYPIDILASVFRIQQKDRKIIYWTLAILPIHIICYYLKLTHPLGEIVRIVIVDLLRIIIVAAFLIFTTKKTYSAYQNRLVITDSFKKYPLQFFTTIIAMGGLFALVIPAAMNVLKLIGDSSALTTAILSITGGFIAVFGLIKSHQKSELEREQLEVQKQKDARDHIRQLHDSYNDRFDKAVAELNGSDVKAAYTAVPKLAKLADDWLDYEDLSNNPEELEKLENKAKKEVQTIINILCKYIRTIPNNYTHEQLEEFDSLPEPDIEKLTHEADIRRLIFSEMSDRSSKITIENGEISTTPGIWSEFDFNFSQAPIFYPLINLTIEKGNFIAAQFYVHTDFRLTCFIQNANFQYAIFSEEALFCGARFMNNASFFDAVFTQDACFCQAFLTQDADFSHVTFAQLIDFRQATFGQEANFGGATFTKNGFFRAATFKAKPKFTYSDERGRFWRAQFSASVGPQDYDFTVYGSIDLREATLLGETFEIPLDTLLFDPMSPKNMYGNYSGLSSPAKSKEDSGPSLKILTL